jgi:hypothetical protein
MQVPLCLFCDSHDLITTTIGPRSMPPGCEILTVAPGTPSSIEIQIVAPLDFFCVIGLENGCQIKYSPSPQPLMGVSDASGPVGTVRSEHLRLKEDQWSLLRKVCPVAD